LHWSRSFVSLFKAHSCSPSAFRSMLNRSRRLVSWPLVALVPLILSGCSLGIELGVGYDRVIRGIDAGFAPNASVSILLAGSAEDGRVVVGGLGGTAVGELGEGGETMAVAGQTLTYASRGFMGALEAGVGTVSTADGSEEGFGLGLFVGRGFVLGPAAIGIGPRLTTASPQAAVSVGGQARALLLFWH
jgi:hypothetical protein